MVPTLQFFFLQTIFFLFGGLAGEYCKQMADFQCFGSAVSMALLPTFAVTKAFQK